MRQGFVEQELKLEAPADFSLDCVAGVPLDSRFFTSVYRDTPDLRLLRCGITLRRRLESGSNVWQLKLPLADGRRELELPGGPASPPDEIAQLLVAIVRDRKLTDVARMQTRREGIRVTSNGSVADVVVDSVTVLDGMRAQETFSEVEIELVSGDARALATVAKSLRDLGAKRSKDESKLARTLRPAAPKEQASDEGRLHAYLAEHFTALLAADPSVRLGADPDAVHRMRVAIRRTRGALRTARPLLVRQWAEDLRGELGWLGRELGPLRDLDVALAELRNETGGLDADDRTAARRLIDLLDEDRTHARARAHAAIDDERYIELLDRLEAGIAELPLVETDESLDGLARRAFRRARKHVNRLGENATDEELHALRIDGKRARYAAELVGGKRPLRVAERAKDFQDVIGKHQDAVVLEGMLRSITGRIKNPSASLAAGRLVERQRERRREARAKLDRTWKRLDAAGTKAWT